MWAADIFDPSPEPGAAHDAAVPPDPGESGLLAQVDAAGGFLPDIDRDSDGVLDTATVSTADGMAVLTDHDGDGRADAVTTIDRDGRWQVYERAANTWETGRSGTIGK